MAKRDYYAVLGVERSADEDTIKRAYRDLARRYHPDVNDSEDAQARFVEIQESYAVLSDPKKRAAYDRFGHAGVGGAAGPGGAGGGAPFDMDDLGSVFDAFFGGGSGARTRAGSGTRRKRGPAQTRHTIDVAFLVSVTGGRRQLEIQRGGTTQTVDVVIPEGVEDGAKLRVRGVGHADPDDPGRRGDLILTVRLEPHPLFRRGRTDAGEQPRDVYLELPLTIAEATLGATIRIPTPTGAASVTVPAGARSGQKLRLRGQGCQTTPPGDLYAVLMLDPPPEEVVDEEAQTVLKRLSEATPIRRGGLWPESDGASPG
ncbi:MAG: DnaJ C-terminal domain-containing protein [Planctomycetota bacterium]